MALTSAERVGISKKVVQIPDEILAAQQAIIAINKQLLKAQDADNANKSFLDGLTNIIDPYQDEVERHNGVVRFKVTEVEIQKSPLREVGNFFFPTDGSTPTPSIPDGYWKQIAPFANNLAVGKNYQEAFGSNPDYEKDIIDQIQAKIAQMETYTDVQRTTGQHCVTDPDTMVDSVETFTALRNLGDEIKTLVSQLRTWIFDTVTLVQSNPDTDPTRSTQNQSFIDDSNATIQAIDNWLALNDYDTSHGITDDCVAFNSLDVNVDLGPTKFRPAELNAFEVALSDRDSRLDLRITEVVGNLGDVNQDLNDGSTISKSGLYGQRFLILQARLNLANGTLSRIKGLENSIKLQENSISSNEDTLEGYEVFIVASKFRADSSGSFVIHALDASGFSVSDQVYIAAENQPELVATVDSVDGNRVNLNIDVSRRYRRDNLARIYKII